MKGQIVPAVIGIALAAVVVFHIGPALGWW